MDFMFDEIKPNGRYYLDNIDFEIPIRIQNKLKNEYFKNELDFYKKLEELTIKHTSYYLFPNNVCCFYPKVTEQIASKEYTCQISAAKIKKGENYYCYRPILENLTTNKVYTIKKVLLYQLVIWNIYHKIYLLLKNGVKNYQNIIIEKMM